MASFCLPPESLAGGPVGAAISTELVTFYAERFGRGPTKARTYVSDDVVLCIMRDAETAQDRALQEAGQGKVARNARAAIRERYARELASIVESATQRRVTSTLGDFDPEHGIVALVFPLARPNESRK